MGISHFDLSSLISMARMQSAQRKKARKIEKVVPPACLYVSTSQNWIKKSYEISLFFFFAFPKLE